MSFQDVKAIYDSLPEDQKRLVSPRGEFVDSPRLAIRTVTPEKDGYAETYNMPGNKAFVTIAVSPDAQGKGKGVELLQQTIARARVDGIRKLIYRLASSNEASKALVRKFVDKPHRKGKDWEEYIIDPATAKDPYSAKLPPSVVKAVEDMKGVYKDMGYDLSDVGVKGTTRSRFESGAVAPFGIMPKEQQVGASWVKTLNSIYFNPDIKAAMKLYGLKGSQEDFVRSLAAHELAHAVDQRYADDKMRKKVLTAARESGFTTPYLDNLPFEQNRDKEVFAEWLASKVMEKNRVTKTASANMVALEKVAGLAGLLGSGIGVLAGSAHRSGELGDAAFGGLLGGASGLVGGSFLAGGKRDGESDDEYRRRRNTDALIWAGILGALGAGAGHALGGSSQNGQR